jgi:hypothetical protein
MGFDEFIVYFGVDSLGHQLAAVHHKRAFQLQFRSGIQWPFPGVAPTDPFGTHRSGRRSLSCGTRTWLTFQLQFAGVRNADCCQLFLQCLFGDFFGFGFAGVFGVTCLWRSETVSNWASVHRKFDFKIFTSIRRTKQHSDAGGREHFLGQIAVGVGWQLLVIVQVVVGFNPANAAPIG